jgi:hypothetical protein
MKPTGEQVLQWAQQTGMYWTLKTEADVSNITDLVTIAYTAGQSNNWQPIETVPKDGDYILVWNSYGVTMVYWDSEWESWIIDSNCPIGLKGTEPTHWMPLPEPPKVSK